MNTEERTLPTALIALIVIAVAIAVMALASDLGALSSREAQAGHVDPIHIPGASNDGKTCADLQGSETWEELKLEEGGLTNCFHTDGTLEVTISN